MEATQTLASTLVLTLTLTPPQAANAQEQMEAGDSYVCHVSLKEKEVIFTDKYLTIVNEKKVRGKLGVGVRVEGADEVLPSSSPTST